MDYIVALELLVFVLLLALSGFFSSSETAMFSLSQHQREQMRREDNPKIDLIERLLSEPRRLIVTILIGNEFVNVAASVISAAIVIRFLGADSKLINLVIMIPILLLLGEITPKTLAIRNNAAFASFQCRPIELFAKLISPLRHLIRVISDFFTTLIVGSERIESSIVTEDMVRTLASEAVGEGVLDQDEARYIDQIFNFGDKTLKDIQTPRSNVFFLPCEMPPSEMIANLRQTRYTKVPIYREHRDVIVGVLHSRDLMGVSLEDIDAHPERLTKLLRDPYLVPENKAAAELFRDFRKRKLSLALTVDEYGGITGLVSMEDLLECIFGDLPSPSDANEEVDIEVMPDGSRHIEGTMTIEQFNREFSLQLEEGEFETVAGMILHTQGELPGEGTTMIVEGVEFTVGEIENNRIQEVIVRRLPADGDTDASKPPEEQPEASKDTDASTSAGPKDAGKDQNGGTPARGQS